MPLVVKDRVRETSVTAGTGTLTLLGPVLGFQSFSVIGDGNTTYYAIVDPNTAAWEVGIGTYSSSGSTLSRDTVFESSTGGSLVNFLSNAKDVFCTYPAERAVYVDGSSIVPATAAVLGVASGGTGASTLTGVLKGNGSSPITASNVNLSSEVTGILPVANGGTNASAPTNAKINLEVITSATGSSVVPYGTTGQRDGSPVTGYLRFNTELASFEGYNGTTWGGIGGAQAGGAIVTNKTTASASYTIASGENGFSVGPITVASGVTVTVSSGQRWLIL